MKIPSASHAEHSRQDINGEYVRTGTMHNDRPVYKKGPLHVFLSRTGSARPHDHAHSFRHHRPPATRVVLSARLANKEIK